MHTPAFDYRQLARTLAAARVAVGVTLLAAPGFSGSRWIGDAARQREVKLLTRSMGVRDLALGWGTLQSLETGEAARRWVVLSALSDGVDLVATALATPRIGWRRAIPVMVTAAVAAGLGAAAIDQLD